MSTRAIIRFATREPGVSFSEHPKTWHAQFYKHHDGYVEALGLDIANSILDRQVIDEWEIDNLYVWHDDAQYCYCLLYTSPSPRDVEESRMPSSA